MPFLEFLPTEVIVIHCPIPQVIAFFMQQAEY